MSPGWIAAVIAGTAFLLGTRRVTVTPLSNFLHYAETDNPVSRSAHSFWILSAPCRLEVDAVCRL
jgi:hypothetical protein